MEIDSSSPAPSQVEVTLFGPGYGESILVHFGSNRWLIVDSCIEPKNRQPAALQYLQSRGIAPEEAVDLVVATHWHDDHIRGLSEVVDACSQARFSCSLAFRREEFIAAISRFNKNNKIAGRSGVRELWKIYHLLAKKSRHPRLASTGMKIFSMSGEKLAHRKKVQVCALSPSDYQVDKFLVEIGNSFPGLGRPKFRATSLSPNQNALVILVEIGELAILLGADLEEVDHPDLGWSAVIRNRDPLQHKASVYKVAHHGSANAHHDGIWSDLLLANPYAVLTPWNRAKGLPKNSDIKRMVRLTKNGYITSPPKQAASKVRREAAVERTIQETLGKKLRQAQPPFGALRLRTTKDNFAEWRIELSDKASSLGKLLD